MRASKPSTAWQKLHGYQVPGVWLEPHFSGTAHGCPKPQLLCPLPSCQGGDGGSPLSRKLPAVTLQSSPLIPNATCTGVSEPGLRHGVCTDGSQAV